MSQFDKKTKMDEKVITSLTDLGGMYGEHTNLTVRCRLGWHPRRVASLRAQSENLLYVSVHSPRSLQIPTTILITRLCAVSSSNHLFSRPTIPYGGPIDVTFMRAPARTVIITSVDRNRSIGKKITFGFMLDTKWSSCNYDTSSSAAAAAQLRSDTIIDTLNPLKIYYP